MSLICAPRRTHTFVDNTPTDMSGTQTWVSERIHPEMRWASKRNETEVDMREGERRLWRRINVNKNKFLIFLANIRQTNKTPKIIILQIDISNNFLHSPRKYLSWEQLISSIFVTTRTEKVRRMTTVKTRFVNLLKYVWIFLSEFWKLTTNNNSFCRLFSGWEEPNFDNELLA